MTKEQKSIVEPWPVSIANADGELLLDVLETPDEFIAHSTIAGVEARNIKIEIKKNILTIRGSRFIKIPDNAKYVYRECYFGSFSRSVTLPQPVEENKIEAIMKNGVLTVILPKKNSNSG